MIISAEVELLSEDEAKDLLRRFIENLEEKEDNGDFGDLSWHEWLGIED